MQVNLLGPLEVVVAGEDVVIPGARQRALVAVLALDVGRVVSQARLIESVWGDEQRADPRNALQGQVSQLRRRLRTAGADSVVGSRASGYVLDLDPDAVDAVRFERLASQGADLLAGGDAQTAGRLLREALALWRGPALADLQDSEAVRHAVVGLDEARLAAIEARIESDLLQGRHAQLVGELESLTVQHPLREGLRSQLMLALYRCGRQAEALAVFEDTRLILAEELGIDPGVELRRRHEAILRQDDEPPPPPTAVELMVDPHTSTVSPAGPSIPSRVPGNLRAAVSSFVGRENDVERVSRLAEAARLVTLTGPGGVGKTRLAVEVGRFLQAQGVPDGVWFVDLAAIHDPTLVAEQVARTLAVPEASAFVPDAGQDTSSQDAHARLVAAIGARRLLLILDNAEHLIDGVATFVADLLRDAETVTVLCTSREALGIAGETVWSVASLTTPPPAVEVTLGDLQGSTATRLFLDRAHAAAPEMTVSDEHAGLVAQICRRLDGIPLALELAAARLRSFGLAQLASLLDDRFGVLTGGDRTAMPRQRTLRATVEWSWTLLDPAEQQLFRRLSVFTGSVDLPTIEAVCSDTDDPAASDLAVTLARLVERSLVVPIDQAGTTRYTMLETLRAFASEQLNANGEASWLHHRLANHTSRWALELAPQLRTASQVAAMRELDARLGDIRTSLSWYANHEELDQGARLAGGLGWYWYLRGYRSEALRWMATFREAPEPVAAAVVTTWWAFRSLGLVPTSQIRPAAEDALTSLRKDGKPDDHGFAASVAAYLALTDGDLDACTRYLEEARTAADDARDHSLHPIVGFVEGAAQLQQGRLDDAEATMTNALDGFLACGDRWGQVQCLIALTAITELTQQLDRAIEHAQHGLRIAEELAMPDLNLFLHARRADLARARGETDQYASSTVEIRRAAEDVRSASPTLLRDRSTSGLDLSTAHEIASAWFRRTEVPESLAYTLGRLGAAQFAAELQPEDRPAGDSGHIPQWQVVEALEVLAAAAAKRPQDAISSARLLGVSDALRQRLDATAQRGPAGRTAHRAVTSTLGESACADALSQGSAAGPTETLELLDSIISPS